MPPIPKKFGAFDQNLLTEWHVRYRGPGVLIYWHVERKAMCIFSQLKSCSSSEVAAMIEGVLRHCTEMAVDRNYVDTHGQSEVAFAMCSLLGFRLLPRLKGIHRQKLSLVEAGDAEKYPNLQLILRRSINWDLIRQQYGLKCASVSPGAKEPSISFISFSLAGFCPFCFLQLVLLEQQNAIFRCTTRSRTRYLPRVFCDESIAEEWLQGLFE